LASATTTAAFRSEATDGCQRRDPSPNPNPKPVLLHPNCTPLNSISRLLSSGYMCLGANVDASRSSSTPAWACPCTAATATMLPTCALSSHRPAAPASIVMLALQFLSHHQRHRVCSPACLFYNRCSVQIKARQQLQPQPWCPVSRRIRRLVQALRCLTFALILLLKLGDIFVQATQLPTAKTRALPMAPAISPVICSYCSRLPLRQHQCSLRPFRYLDASEISQAANKSAVAGMCAQ
jgi:hypothetical protein